LERYLLAVLESSNSGGTALAITKAASTTVIIAARAFGGMRSMA